MTEPEVKEKRISPAPLPIQFLTVPVRVNAGDEGVSNAVMIGFITPQGENYFFLAASGAEKLKTDLENAIRTINTGLIVPDNGNLVTP